MKVVRNSLIPFRGFAAINLFGLLFVRREAKISDQLINHERIHTRQQLELLFLPFYVLYVAEWLVRFLFNGFNGLKAYRNLSFEREAYANQSKRQYLSRRPLFAQWRRPPGQSQNNT